MMMAMKTRSIFESVVTPQDDAHVPVEKVLPELHPAQEQEVLETPELAPDEQSHPDAPSHPHPQLTLSVVLCVDPEQYELLVHV